MDKDERLRGLRYRMEDAAKKYMEEADVDDIGIKREDGKYYLWEGRGLEI